MFIGSSVIRDGYTLVKLFSDVTHVLTLLTILLRVVRPARPHLDVLCVSSLWRQWAALAGECRE